MNVWPNFRLTPQLVAQAYSDTGLRPIARSFLVRGRGGACGACAITAVYCYANGITAPLTREQADDVRVEAVNKREAGGGYLCGVMLGYDGRSRLEDGPVALGLEDGHEIRAALDPKDVQP